MKNIYKNSVVLLFFVLFCSTLSFARFYQQNVKGQNMFLKDGDRTKEVLNGYIGWVNNPDSLNVYIDNTWTDAEKDSCRTAIQRWNDAGCTPKFKEVSDFSDANINITKRKSR